MSKKVKSIITGGLFRGIVYASIMAGFDYADGENFKICRFLIHALIFGFFMGCMTFYNLKKIIKHHN